MRKNLLLLYLFVMGITNTVANDLQLYQAGKKAFSVGLYSIALENFDLYLKEDIIEKKVESLYLSGISAYYLKKYNNSITYFDALNSEYPKSVYVNKSLYWNGLNYYYLGDYNNASIFFKKNTEIESNYKDISWLFNALSNLKLGFTDLAILSFNEIINDSLSTPRYKEEALYRLGTLYLDQGNLNSCINLLNVIIFDYPDSKFYNQSLSILADSYFTLKEWQSAERSYLLLLDFEEKSKYYKRLATISWELGNKDKSKEYLQYFDKNYSLDKDVLFMLGDILSKDNDYLESIDIYKRLSKTSLLTEKELIENNYRLGTLYYRDNNFPQAFKYFTLVNSKESLYFAILSGIESDLNILSYIKTLNDRYPGDRLSLDVNNRYINYLDQRDQDTKMEELLTFITELYPNNLSYALTYGELLLEDKRLEESLKYLSKGYKKDSIYYSNIAYKIGWIYYTKGEFGRSISYFEKLKSDDNDYIKALYSKSIANYKIGNLDEGKKGFLKLLKQDTEFNEEISFYLGLIEKDNYRYKEALTYFSISKNKKSLYSDSLDNIAWSYYHLKEYQNALDVYSKLWEINKKNIYKFNSANCYLYMEDYENSLDLYLEVIHMDDSLKSSSYYKSIEILFILNRDIEAYSIVESYFNDFPNSDLPGEVILNVADNRLFENKIDEAMESYTKVMEIFPLGKFWYKARFRIADCFYQKENYTSSILLFIDSIRDNDIYSSDSITFIKKIMSQLADPILTGQIKEMLDENIVDKYRIVSLYTECLSQGVNGENPLDDIDNLILISRDRDEINRLIYLKSLTYYNNGDIDLSSESLKTILSRQEVLSDVKIDAIMLQGQILDDVDNYEEAIDLYLKLYINYPEYKNEASFALYKGLLLTKENGDTQMKNKILNILETEYKDTVWGLRSLNEN